MKLAWLTDIHLNFLDGAALGRFFDQLSAMEVDGWIIAGDIADGHTVIPCLRAFDDTLTVPVYFVLGNHDFYGRSFQTIGGEVSETADGSDRLVWLTQSEPVFLAGDVAVVGDDGWSDARLGHPLNTPIELNDFLLIRDLADRSRADLVETLRHLGDQAAARLAPKIERAARHAKTVVVVTHAPPYEGATWHQGQISSADWLPWFSSKVMGDEISRCATRYPQTRFLVLCGHTHGSGRYVPRENVEVLTGGAEYGAPAVQGILEL